MTPPPALTMSRPFSKANSLPNQLYKPCGNQEIVYCPLSELVSFDWVYSIQVLIHLSTHYEEQCSLLAEATRHSPHKPQMFYIYHPLLRHILQISSIDTDITFEDSINSLIKKWNEAACYIQSLTTTSGPNWLYLYPYPPPDSTNQLNALLKPPEH
jgi:hypothetical protein